MPFEPRVRPFRPTHRPFGLTHRPLGRRTCYCQGRRRPCPPASGSAGSRMAFPLEGSKSLPPGPFTAEPFGTKPKPSRTRLSEPSGSHPL